VPFYVVVMLYKSCYLPDSKSLILGVLCFLLLVIYMLHLVCWNSREDDWYEERTDFFRRYCKQWNERFFFYYFSTNLCLGKQMNLEIKQNLQISIISHLSEI